MSLLSGTTVTVRAAGGSRRAGRTGVAAVAAIVLAIVTAACAGLPPAPDASHLAALPCRQAVPKAAPIAWWSAASRRDRDDLARWCATVGPVLFEPALASQAAPYNPQQVISPNSVGATEPSMIMPPPSVNSACIMVFPGHACTACFSNPKTRQSHSIASGALR